MVQISYNADTLYYFERSPHCERLYLYREMVKGKAMTEQESPESNQTARVEPPFKRVRIIINPGAGMPQPILRTINDVFHPAGVSWKVSITQKAGDAERFAREAIEAGDVDVVAVYGGDGTVMEVARGLSGTDMPMAIFPGGTANVMSCELSIPLELAAAARLLCEGNHTIRKVDMARARGELFLLRLGMGAAAEMTQGADRETKGRLGNLAYMLSALEALQNQQVTKYTFIIDGQKREAEGITCFIANSGNLGRAGLRLSPSIEISDGLLDVIVFSPVNIGAVLGLAANAIISYGDLPPEHPHWQGKKVEVHADPPQIIECDGEIIDPTPIDVEIVPLALRLIVPAEADPDYIKMKQLEEQNIDA